MAGAAGGLGRAGTRLARGVRLVAGTWRGARAGAGPLLGLGPLRGAGPSPGVDVIAGADWGEAAEGPDAGAEDGATASPNSSRVPTRCRVTVTGVSTPWSRRYWVEARAATARSWVIMIRAAPLWAHWASRSSMTAVPVSTSSAPVGSSARMTRGWRAMARAMATRCCSPPDRSPIGESTLSPRPTASSSSPARAVRVQKDLPVSYSRGAATFSVVLRPSMRLKDWNTKPKVAPRRRARRPSDRRVASWSSRV